LIALATHRAAGVLWLRLELAEARFVPVGDRPALRRDADVLYSPSALGNRDARAIDHHRVFFTCASFPFEEVVPLGARHTGGDQYDLGSPLRAGALSRAIF
jgi:hypothetical protein